MKQPGDWTRLLLEGRHYATLGTQNDDGSIHLTPVWYMFREGRLFVATHSLSRKARNIVARPNASLVVDVRKPGSEKWVSAVGKATVLGADESRQINLEIHKRYLTPEALQDPRIGPTFEAADDVTISITPVKWRSWEAKDVDVQFFGGTLTATPERWFLPVD